MKLKTWEEMWDYLFETEIATAQELSLICAINGSSTETMESVLYVRTGYRSFDQLGD